MHAYDQAEVVAGQGTVGLETLEQTGGVDTVLVAVGGGGLIAGIVAALDGRARVVAVEPELIPTLNRALEAGGPVKVGVSGVGADALGASQIGAIAYDLTSAAGVRSVLVSDEAIVDAPAGRCGGPTGSSPSTRVRRPSPPFAPAPTSRPPESGWP